MVGIDYEKMENSCTLYVVRCTLYNIQRTINQSCANLDAFTKGPSYLKSQRGFPVSCHVSLLQGCVNYVVSILANIF